MFDWPLDRVSLLQGRAVKDISTASKYGMIVERDRNTVPKSLLTPLIPMSRKKPTKAAAKNEPERNLPINWYVPEYLKSKYATNIIVQATENEFIISFYELPPPIILNPVEDLKNLDSVTAECVARIIVAGNKMPEFLDVLTRQVKAYQEKKAQEQAKKQ